MTAGDLDVKLLHQIMVRLGELRVKPPLDPPSEGNLMQLVNRGSLTGMAVLNHLQRHTNFLQEKGLLKISSLSGVYRVLRLTEKGQSYVQPELSEFGEKPMLPAVVKSVEDQIAVLTYPEEEKAGFIHRLRQAVADKAPEVIVQIVLELGKRAVGGGP